LLECKTTAQTLIKYLALALTARIDPTSESEFRIWCAIGDDKYLGFSGFRRNNELVIQQTGEPMGM
jgi:hypothetical protein